MGSLSVINSALAFCLRNRLRSLCIDFENSWVGILFFGDFYMVWQFLYIVFGKDLILKLIII